MNNKTKLIIAFALLFFGFPLIIILFLKDHSSTPSADILLQAVPSKEVLEERPIQTSSGGLFGTLHTLAQAQINSLFDLKQSLQSKGLSFSLLTTSTENPLFKNATIIPDDHSHSYFLAAQFDKNTFLKSSFGTQCAGVTASGTLLTGDQSPLLSFLLTSQSQSYERQIVTSENQNKDIIDVALSLPATVNTPFVELTPGCMSSISKQIIYSGESIRVSLPTTPIKDTISTTLPPESFHWITPKSTDKKDALTEIPYSSFKQTVPYIQSQDNLSVEVAFDINAYFRHEKYKNVVLEENAPKTVVEKEAFFAEYKLIEKNKVIATVRSPFRFDHASNANYFSVFEVSFPARFTHLPKGEYELQSTVYTTSILDGSIRETPIFQDSIHRIGIGDIIVLFQVGSQQVYPQSKFVENWNEIPTEDVQRRDHSGRTIGRPFNQCLSGGTCNKVLLNGPHIAFANALEQLQPSQPRIILLEPYDKLEQLASDIKNKDSLLRKRLTTLTPNSYFLLLSAANHPISESITSIEKGFFKAFGELPHHPHLSLFMLNSHELFRHISTLKTEFSSFIDAVFDMTILVEDFEKDISTHTQDSPDYAKAQYRYMQAIGSALVSLLL